MLIPRLSIVEPKRQMSRVKLGIGSASVDTSAVIRLIYRAPPKVDHYHLLLITHHVLI